MQVNKQLVINFFQSDFYLNPDTFDAYIHAEASINWNGSTGFSQLSHESFKHRVLEMGKSYKKITPKISHVIAEGNKVCIRILLLVEVSELEETEQLADFTSIWEIKDNQLWKGFIHSNPSDDTEENFESFTNSI